MTPKLHQKARVGFPGPRIEIPAKAFRANIGYIGDFLQLDLPFEVLHGVVVDSVDAVVFGFKALRLKTDRGKGLYIPKSAMTTVPL